MGSVGSFEFFPLQDVEEEEPQSRYEAIIFDPYFSSPQEDCQLKFVRSKEQLWTPKLAYTLKTHRSHEVVPMPANLVYKRPPCDTLVDSNQLAPLPSLPKSAISVAKGLLKTLDPNTFNETGVSEEECISPPEEIFNLKGLTSLLQLGSLKKTSDVEEQLPGLMVPIMKGILLPIQKLFF